MRNVEFKAELRDPALAQMICRSLGASRTGEFEQTDTYYRVTSGRLKRRESPGDPVEFIFYDRPDDTRASESRYTIYTEAEALSRFGVTPLPVLITVRKRRELFLIGNIRIHLDDVLDLGRFIEFEAVISRDHPVELCHELIANLRQSFAPVMGEPIAGSYSDLLISHRSHE